MKRTDVNVTSANCSWPSTLVVVAHRRADGGAQPSLSIGPLGHGGGERSEQPQHLAFHERCAVAHPERIERAFGEGTQHLSRLVAECLESRRRSRRRKRCLLAPATRGVEHRL